MYANAILLMTVKSSTQNHHLHHILLYHVIVRFTLFDIGNVTLHRHEIKSNTNGNIIMAAVR